MEESLVLNSEHATDDKADLPLNPFIKRKIQVLREAPLARNNLSQVLVETRVIVEVQRNFY